MYSAATNVYDAQRTESPPGISVLDIKFGDHSSFFFNNKTNL